MSKRKSLVSFILALACVVCAGFAFISLTTNKVFANQSQVSMRAIVKDYYKENVIIKKDSTGTGADQVGYSGLVPYGTGEIFLGTYDMTENANLSKPLFEILPQNAWSSSNASKDTDLTSKYFKVYLTSGSKKVTYYFTRATRTDAAQYAVFLADTNNTTLNARKMDNISLNGTNYPLTVIPYAYDGTYVSSSVKGEDNATAYTKPEPIGFYYDSGKYYMDCYYQTAKTNVSGVVKETSDSSGVYRYTMKYDHTYVFTADELKNVNVSIEFDCGTVAKQDAWVMFTSIAGKSTSLDYFGCDVNYQTFGGTINDVDYTKQFSAFDNSITDLPTDVTKDNYTFSHWYYGSSSNNVVNDAGFTDWLLAQEGAITLNAHYTLKEYEVNYDLNYTGAPTYLKETINAENYQAFKLKDVEFNDFPSGKIFDGWYTAASGGTKITNISLQDTTVYAHWIDGFIVSIDIDGQIDKFAIEANGILPQPQNPVKVGHTFNGWFIGETLYDFSSVISSDITLTAKFTVNAYKVVFYVGGVKVDEKTVDYGQKIASLPNIPTKIGYKSGVWKSGNQVFTTNSIITANTNVVAVYDKQEFVVNFNTDGGSEISSITVKYGENIDGKEISTNKNGYDLVGWKVDGQDFNFSTAITADVELTAVWQIKEYKVKIIENGQEIATLTKKHGEKISLQEITDASGKEISKLYADGSLTVSYDLETAIDEQLNLFVQFETSSTDSLFIAIISVSSFLFVASIALVVVFVVLKKKGEKKNEV